MKKGTNWDLNYPLVEFIVGLGFFLVYIIEAILLDICIDNRFESSNNDKQMFSSTKKSDELQRKRLV